MTKKEPHPVFITITPHRQHGHNFSIQCTSWLLLIFLSIAWLTIPQLILFICIGSLTYGYCSSIIATTLGQPSFIQYFDLATRSDGESLVGAINGLYQTGGLLRAVSVRYLPDKLGRRWAIFIGGVFCVVGGALQAGSVHIVMFLIARFLVGCGIGCLVTMTPLYQSEVSPTNIREFLVGMHGVMICTGIPLPVGLELVFTSSQAQTNNGEGHLRFKSFSLSCYASASFTSQSLHGGVSEPRMNWSLGSFLIAS